MRSAFFEKVKRKMYKRWILQKNFWRFTPMNGIRKPAVILADSMEEYMAMPDPYRLLPKSKLKIYELGKYAERVGKKSKI